MATTPTPWSKLELRRAAMLRVEVDKALKGLDAAAEAGEAELTALYAAHIAARIEELVAGGVGWKLPFSFARRSVRRVPTLPRPTGGVRAGARGRRAEHLVREAAHAPEEGAGRGDGDARGGRGRRGVWWKNASVAWKRDS